MISEQNKKVLDELLAGYNALPFYKKWFYPHDLRVALKGYEEEKSTAAAFAIWRAYVINPWFFQLSFTKSSLSIGLGKLHDAGLLVGNGAEANFNAVLEHQDTRSVVGALLTLKSTDLLTGEGAEANRDAIVAHQNPMSMADALAKLNRTDLLTGSGAQANRNALLVHQYPPLIAHALNELNRAQLLTGESAQANRNAVVAHPKNPEGVAHVLIVLSLNGLLTVDNAQANRNAVLAHQEPFEVYHALTRLNLTRLLTGEVGQANFNAVLEHKDTRGLADAFARLNSDDLLLDMAAQANFDAVVAHQYPRGVADALVSLSMVGLLGTSKAQANRNAVVAHKNPQLVANAIKILNRARILPTINNQPYFDAVVAHQNPVDVANAIGKLNSDHLLGGEEAEANLGAVAMHPNPVRVANAIRSLNEHHLLTGDGGEANRDAIVRHQNPEGVAVALLWLKRADILSGKGAQANRDAVVTHRDIVELTEALRRICLLGGDNPQANFNAVVLHQDPEGVANALHTLKNVGLLTGETAQANRDAVVAHQNPKGMANALHMLNNAGLLTGETARANRDAVLLHQDPGGMANVASRLHRIGLLRTTQANFDSIAITHRDILTHIDSFAIWASIPDHLLTRDRFEAIMAICNHNHANPVEGRRLFRHYVNRDILGIEAGQALAAAAFNPAQSTHTASLHASVTASAIKLNELYRADIAGAKVDGVIKELSRWLMEAPGDSLILNAAKRCLPRLTAPDYFFQDPGSNVSTTQLLALAWIAIHDESKRNGSLDDAKQLLIEGLYEIQREYNINGVGVDNHAYDIPACPGGTFNKIMEKLCGIHPAVEVNFITLPGASLKFPRVLNETAVTVFRELAMTPMGQKQLVGLLAEIKAPANQNRAEPIWDLLKDTVADKIFAEFNVLFPSGKESPNFVGIVEYGMFAELTDATIEALEGFVVSASPHEGAFASSHGFFAPTTSTSVEPVVQLTAAGGGGPEGL